MTTLHDHSSPPPAGHAARALGWARGGGEALLRNWPLIALLGAIALAPETAYEAFIFCLESLWRISPMVLFALLVTAYATASGAIGLIAQAFHGKQSRMILVASTIGAFTPVCGVTVFPLVAGLMAARAPLAPIMAFWLSSPITSPGMLAVTAATLGAPFAIGKTAAAFGCGVVSGVITLALTRRGFLSAPARETSLAGFGDAGCGADSCGADGRPGPVHWRFWRTPERLRLFGRSAFANAKLMVFWLSIAFALEFFLRRYVPDAWVADLVGVDSDYAVMLAATVGAPIYLDGYAALPLIRGLMEAGMRPDAAMAFIIAGGAISLWVAAPVYALVRLPVFLLYVGLAVFCSMLSGWAYGAYLALV